MKVSQQMLLEIAQDIWASMLWVDLRDYESQDDSLAIETECLTGSVHIYGKPELEVVVTLSSTLARKATAAMLAVGLEEVSEELACDAVGELTNLVAGSFKNRLSGRSRLSAPIVTQGPRETQRFRVGSVMLLDLILTSRSSSHPRQLALIEVHQSLTL